MEDTKEVEIHGLKFVIKKLTWKDTGYIQSQGTKVEVINGIITPRIDMWLLKNATILKGTISGPETISPDYIAKLSPYLCEGLFEKIDAFNLPPRENQKGTKETNKGENKNNK